MVTDHYGAFACWLNSGCPFYYTCWGSVSDYSYSLYMDSQPIFKMFCFYWFCTMYCIWAVVILNSKHTRSWWILIVFASLTRTCLGAERSVFLEVCIILISFWFVAPSLLFGGMLKNRLLIFVERMCQCDRIIHIHFRNRVQISHILLNKTMSTLLTFCLIVLYIDVYCFTSQHGDITISRWMSEWKVQAFVRCLGLLKEENNLLSTEPRFVQSHSKADIFCHMCLRSRGVPWGDYYNPVLLHTPCKLFVFNVE